MSHVLVVIPSGCYYQYLADMNGFCGYSNKLPICVRSITAVLAGYKYQ